MKMCDAPTFLAQVFTRFFGICPRGAEHYGTSLSQSLGKEIMDPFQFAVSGDRLNFKPEILTLHTALKHGQLPPGLGLKVGHDLFFDVALGRGCKTGDRW